MDSSEFRDTELLKKSRIKTGHKMSTDFPPCKRGSRFLIHYFPFLNILDHDVLQKGNALSHLGCFVSTDVSTSTTTH